MTASTKPSPPSAAKRTGLLDKIQEWIAQTAGIQARFEDIRLAGEQLAEQVMR